MVVLIKKIRERINWSGSLQDNILIKGDPMKNESFVPVDGGNKFAIELIQQIDEMNNGQYLYEETKTVLLILYRSSWLPRKTF